MFAKKNTEQFAKKQEITARDLFDILSLEESAKMIYIPFILTDISFRYIDEFIKFSVSKRLDNKKVVRKLRENMKEYGYSRNKDIDLDAAKKLSEQVDSFFETVNWDITTLYFSINSELKKCYPEFEDYEYLTYLYMAVSLMKYVRQFEHEYENIIQQRTKIPYVSIANVSVENIRCLCETQLNDTKIESTPIIDLAIKIIAKKLSEIIFEIE